MVKKNADEKITVLKLCNKESSNNYIILLPQDPRTQVRHTAPGKVMAKIRVSNQHPIKNLGSSSKMNIFTILTLFHYKTYNLLLNLKYLTCLNSISCFSKEKLCSLGKISQTKSNKAKLIFWNNLIN